MPRMQNQIADALAKMASMMDEPKEDKARPIVVEQKEEPAYCTSIEGDEENNGKVNGIQTFYSTSRMRQIQKFQTRMMN